MDLVIKVLSLPATYIFLGVLAMPVMIFAKGRNRLPNATGYKALVAGTLLLSIATFFGVLNELNVDNVFVQFRLLNWSAEDTRLMLLYLPGLLGVIFGLSKSLPNIRQMAEEVERRAKAEEELRLMLAEMQQLTLKAEQANRAKSSFLAGMSHELRTPLNAIIGFSELLTSTNYENSDEQKQEYQQIILKSGKHLLSLINDILDLSKIEDGKLDINVAEWDVNKAISDACETIQLAAAEKNISIDVHSEEHLIATDGRFFKQILINILSNSIKFSNSNSKITITTKSTGDKLSIVIEDEGIGMTEEEVANATEPFYQAEDTYNRTSEGTGLGLALVKRFVEFIGGDLAITSVYGQGTIVAIEVPNLTKNEQSKFKELQEMAKK